MASNIAILSALSLSAVSAGPAHFITDNFLSFPESSLLLSRSRSTSTTPTSFVSSTMSPILIFPTFLASQSLFLSETTSSALDGPTSTSSSYTATTTPIVDSDPTSSSASKRTFWAQPAMITDLASFNVTNFASGKYNLQIVNGIPASASASASEPALSSTTIRVLYSSSKLYLVSEASPTPAPVPNSTWDNTTSFLQVFYPSGSVNPAQTPVGGMEFYASPLPISYSRNVTLEYSVFFPLDFDWVLGGKLPGLYGGHTGCSGGNAAFDCFSTRLMWRKGGIGELYLYAPRDKQSHTLCSDPHSVCDSTYGISIGRGSFTWVVGNWTTVRQFVSLNTPGNANGVIALDVNGERAIYREDIFYRDNLGSIAPSPSSSPSTPSPSRHFDWPSFPSLTPPPMIPPFTGFAPGNLGFLGSLLGGLSIPGGARSNLELEASPMQEQGSAKSVKLVGLFFSTFFGGHEDQWKTPRDQYSWFKDFALSIEDEDA